MKAVITSCIDMPIRFIVLALVFSVAAVANEDQEQDEPLSIPAMEMKQTERCISVNRIKSTTVIDDQTILFRIRGDKQQQVNRLKRRCPGLASEKRFGYEVRTGKLCRGDIIFVLASFGTGSRCSLGYFEPYIGEEELRPEDSEPDS